MFSAGASPPSTPDSSNLDEVEDDLAVLAQKQVLKTSAAISKKRALEDEDELELQGGAGGRAAKRRVVQQTAYVEISVGKVTKVNAIVLNT